MDDDPGTQEAITVRTTTSSQARARARTWRGWRVVAAVAATTVLVACSSSSGGASDSAGAGGGLDGGADSAADAPMDPSGGVHYEQADSPSEEARSVIQTGWVWLTSADPVSAGEEVIALVASAGGRTDSRSFVTEAEYRHPSASLVVRIPAERLDATIAEIGEIAEVEQSEISAEDVTATVVDLDARIRAKELSIERLEGMLAGATTSADLIAAENTLTDRQTELEQLLAEQARLGDLVAMATVTVEIQVPGEVPVVQPAGFTSGLDSGWNSVVATVRTGLVAIGFLIPWLLPAAVVGAAILGIRWWRGRAHERATAPPIP